MLFVSLVGNVTFVNCRNEDTIAPPTLATSPFLLCLGRSPSRYIQVFPSLPSDKAYLLALFENRSSFRRPAIL